MNQSRFRKATATTAIAVTAAFALAACSGGGAEKSDDTASGSGGGGGNSGYTFAMVTHETPGDTFWDKIKAGAQQAATDTGSTLKYSNDPDPAKQATLIQNAVDSKVDGIATTLATPDALKGAVQSAVTAKIPTVAFNSGINQWRDMGGLEYLGQDETLDGESAGKASPPEAPRTSAV